MNAAQVLDHFDRISDAPDAIPRLRRFILDLAMRGRLVERDPNDEPACELLKRIQEKKAPFDANTRGKTGKARARLDSDENSFELPKGWATTPLAELTAVLNGRAYSKNELLDSGTPILRVGNLFTSSHWYYSNLELEDDKYCDAGDLLFAWSASFGPFIWPGPKVIYHYHIWKLRLYSDSDLNKFYLYNFLRQKTQEIKESGHGVSMIHMTKEKMEQVVVPVPPLAEQRRIVAKVDELMALCDRLEAAKTERESRRDKLAAASLHRLNNGADAEFREHARFHLLHLQRLTTRPEHIQQLRQTILRLAVVGRLTEPEENGPAAHEEVQKVEAKKKELGLRKSKTTEPVPVEEEWCELPSRWVWARWDQVTDWITYGFTRPMPHASKGIPIVTGKNVNSGEIIFESAHRTTEDAYSELNEKDRPKKGDILLTKDGSIGRSAIVDTEQPFCINQSVAALWLRSCHFDRRFLQLAIDCPQTQRALLAKTEGVAIKHISVVDFGKMVFPLPPLAEQHRIVAKIDELMALCDRLEARLTTTQTESRLLLEAVLHEALNGET